MNKREQIITALAELSRTRGFYRVTMDELAAHAGVSKRTIYRHFRSKDEIVEALLNRFMNHMGGQLEQIINCGQNSAEVLTGIISFVTQHGILLNNTQVLDDLRRYYPGLWSKVEHFRAEKIQQNFVKLLVTKNNQGLREMDPRILAAALSASVQAVINPEFILSNEMTFEGAVKQLIGLFMYGVIADEKGHAAE